jgi:hypothetical protein
MKPEYQNEYEKGRASFIMVARKTTRLLAELQSARWQPSPRTDADEQCEFWYQPEGWGKAYRFIALRYQKKDPLPEREQYQLFDSSQYIYRVFVTNMKRPIDLLAWFYNQRAGAENLIKEANNDAGQKRRFLPVAINLSFSHFDNFWAHVRGSIDPHRGEC